MIEVKLVYDNNTNLNEIGDYLQSPIFCLIDMTTSKGQKEGYKLKGHWGAKLNPFAIVYQDNKPIKAFYSEAEDVISNLINYLNNEQI